MSDFIIKRSSWHYKFLRKFAQIFPENYVDNTCDYAQILSKWLVILVVLIGISGLLFFWIGFGFILAFAPMLLDLPVLIPCSILFGIAIFVVMMAAVFGFLFVMYWSINKLFDLYVLSKNRIKSTEYIKSGKFDQNVVGKFCSRVTFKE